jgi:serine/threonine protein kinase
MLQAALADGPVSEDVQSQDSRGEQPGTRIGHYKLLEQIGEGGFGIVWMAEQEEPVRRRVALKIIKLGMDTREVVARFEAERQALSMMEHPNIACVFDGGATATGRPYFVMELVKGVPITTYCDANQPATLKGPSIYELSAQQLPSRTCNSTHPRVASHTAHHYPL